MTLAVLTWDEGYTRGSDQKKENNGDFWSCTNIHGDHTEAPEKAAICDETTPDYEFCFDKDVKRKQSEPPLFSITTPIRLKAYVNTRGLLVCVHLIGVPVQKYCRFAHLKNRRYQRLVKLDYLR